MVNPGEHYEVTIGGRVCDALVLAVDVNSKLALFEADLNGREQLLEVGIRVHGDRTQKAVAPEQAGGWGPLVEQAGYTWPRPWASVPADLFGTRLDGLRDAATMVRARIATKQADQPSSGSRGAILKLLHSVLGEINEAIDLERIGGRAW